MVSILSNLGNFAIVLVIGWVIISFAIARAIVWGKKGEDEDTGCMEQIGKVIIFLVLTYVIAMAPVYIINFLIKNS